MKHFVDDAALIRVARSPLLSADDKAAVQNALERWLSRQRTAPSLVGSTAAAKILGVQPPHLARLRDQGRMPEAIPVDGSVDVYVREEVEELAGELRAERAARAARRAEREATS